MFSWIFVILAGAFIGWIASKIMGTDASMGAVANIGAGLVGAAIGRALAPMVGLAPQGTDFTIGGVLMGVVGACILIGILKLVSGSGGSRRAV